MVWDMRGMSKRETQAGDIRTSVDRRQGGSSPVRVIRGTPAPHVWSVVRRSSKVTPPAPPKDEGEPEDAA